MRRQADPSSGDMEERARLAVPVLIVRVRELRELTEQLLVDASFWLASRRRASRLTTHAGQVMAGLTLPPIVSSTREVSSILLSGGPATVWLFIGRFTTHAPVEAWLGLRKSLLTGS